MKRLLAALSALALMISATGCCHHLCGGGGGFGCPPPCDPCAPGGGPYGGAYPSYSQVYTQPAYSTAVLPSTGVATASAAPACDCGPTVPPY